MSTFIVTLKFDPILDEDFVFIEVPFPVERKILP